MANSKDNNTQIIDPEAVTDEQVVTAPEAEVPAVKTKKELKKERKEIKKHKKEVKKEAKKHSAKATRAYKFLITVISLVVIVAMVVCSVMAVQITMNLNGAATSTESNDENDDAASENTTVAPSSSNATSNADSNADSNAAVSESSSDASTDNSAESNDSAADAAATPLGSKADVVEYYKTAHAKVLSEAKSVTRTYDNTLNYQDYLEVGGNSTLAGVAKQLMGMFMKENTEAQVHTGADIATNFPPQNNSCSGLTADMIGDYSVTEDGDNYIITLSINSSEENPDLGDNSANLVRIVESKQVEDAAAGFVEFTGLENRYFAPTITATINKTTGQMTALETDTPSHMCFASATVMKIITVDNVGLGLEYLQKWTVEW